MSVSLAVSAVVARDSRLDDAGTVRRRQIVLVVARMGGDMEQPRRIAPGDLPRLHSRNCVADELAQRLFVHAVTSTVSMIPTMAASTAASFRPSAIPAALPSITTSTFSPTPAPTESIASSV